MTINRSTAVEGEFETIGSRLRERRSGRYQNRRSGTEQAVSEVAKKSLSRKRKRDREELVPSQPEKKIRSGRTTPSLESHSVQQATHSWVNQLQPVLNLNGHDHGLHARARFLDSYGLEGFEVIEESQLGELEAQNIDEILSDKDYEKILSVANKRSSRVASQLFELFYLCEFQEDCNPKQTQKIKEFSVALANTLPEDDDWEMESQVIRTLGNLILVAQYDLKLAAGALQHPSKDQCIESILRLSSSVMDKALTRIQNHVQKHKATALQNCEEAHFHKMSVVMAELLVLDTGGFNFGLLDDLQTHLIPDQFRETVAVKNLLYVLDHLREDPSFMGALARIQKPSDPNLPSNEIIRACLELSPKVNITNKHARIVALSGLLGHLRQQNAGTSFATAWLIKTLYQNLDLCMEDFADVLQNGCLTRELASEKRSFPFQARTSKDALDTMVRINEYGKIIATRYYHITMEQANKQPQLRYSGYLHEAPGIQAACRALGIQNVEETVLEAIQATRKMEFVINELIVELAKIAYQRKTQYVLRSATNTSLSDLVNQAQYAFGAQTNHPLHRAWEASIASMVNYFGSQCAMPTKTFEVLEMVLEQRCRSENHDFKKKMKQLLDHAFLPMISRMRYRYNHHFDDHKLLFEDSQWGGTQEDLFYGYELCDTGLPEDFEYSSTVRQEMEEDTTLISLQRFKNYKAPQEWKTVDTPEKFQEFIVDVLQETAKQNREFKEVADRLCEKVRTEGFNRNMIDHFLGDKNEDEESSITTTPWKFRWGGHSEAVISNYYSSLETPIRMKRYSGSPKELLAYHINYLRNQESDVRMDCEHPFSQTIISSPVHAFLLKPGEPSYLAAVSSELNANEYIRKYVEEPCAAVTDSIMSRTARWTLIDYVADNMWVKGGEQKHDLERQELTETSKQFFDRNLAKVKSFSKMSIGDFRKKIVEVVCQSRAQDPRIGKRYLNWERRFKRVFENKIHAMLPGMRDSHQIPAPQAMALINFARDRQDRIQLSETAAQCFRQEMENVPNGITVKQFRDAIVKAALKAHESEICGRDRSWLDSFTHHFDTKLFQVLGESAKQTILRSAVITADTNLREGIHDIHFAFLVNPGTGEIEMARYYPDHNEIEFMNQSCWFPTQENHYWNFPSRPV